MNVWDLIVKTLEILAMVSVTAFAIFAIMGPFIEIALDMLLPPEDWNDDDENLV